MNSFILANSLCDLAEFFEIQIQKEKIVFLSKQDQTEKELQSMINHFCCHNNFVAKILEDNKTWKMIGFTVDIKPIKAESPSEKHHEGFRVLYPNLRIGEIIYPPKTRFDTKMEKKDVFVGKFLEHSVYHNVKYFEDENGQIHSFSYAEILKYDFKIGSTYEIRCLGLEPKSGFKQYRKKEFEITQISA